MNKIPKTFEKWNDTWSELKRTETYALYERNGKNGKHYEVVRISVRKKDQKWPNGKVTPAGEFLRTGDTDYGLHTWCFKGDDQGLVLATQRFNEVSE